MVLPERISWKEKRAERRPFKARPGRSLNREIKELQSSETGAEEKRRLSIVVSSIKYQKRAVP